MLTVEQATRLREMINSFATLNYREGEHLHASYRYNFGKDWHKHYKELVQKQYDIVFGYLASLTKEGTP